MSQETNLNVAPYFDDFNANNDYYRVLFKPGYPVQARELTTLQSILQNQIEKFGQHFFKEGSRVIPGNISYNRLYYAVELQNTFLGVPVSAYASQLIGTKITGQTSGVTAVVDKILLPNESERGNLTLYINYLSSNTQNNSTQQFSDGESLTCNVEITSSLLGNSVITVGQPFANTIIDEATSIASSFSITNGVYFIRGQFVTVNDETLILDQYSNTSNYRVGLFVNEEIVTSDLDETLNDNSQGFNNYSAPGADRLKITVSLFKKSLNDFNDRNFVELATITDGIVRYQQNTTQNTIQNTLIDEFAKRTYSQSGDYYITPFDISLKESLNNNLGNNGIFNSNQFTYSGSTPSNNLGVYQISPGKAFVRGYECEILSPTFLDSPKPRTTKTLRNQSLNYNTGPTLRLNKVHGFPQIGIGNTYVLSLRDSRSRAVTNIPPGKEIGIARVYDFRLESGSYDSANSDLNQWNISLYDIQTITEIILNEPITLSTPTFIKGKNSGATAFLKDSVSANKNIKVYEKSGEFILGESFIIDGIENTRVATSITSYGISDIKSVYGTVGSGSTFAADVIQSDSLFVGIATVSPPKYASNVDLLFVTLTSNVGVGSTTIFVSNTSNVSVGDSISIGSSYRNAPIVGVGGTFILIGSGATTNGTSLITNLTTNVGIGSTIFYVGFTTGVSIGSSVSIGMGITNARVIGVGDTFFQIGVGDTASPTSRITTISNVIGFGSTVIFVSNTSGVSTASSISVSGFGTIAALTNAPITGVGTTFVTIGSANTSNVGYTTSLLETLAIGSTQIFVGFTTGTGISIGSSFSVGAGLTNVSAVSVGNSFVYIGTGSTVSYAINSGVAVTFRNVSSMIVGSAVTISNVTQTFSGVAVTFTRVSDALSGSIATISSVLNTSTVVSISPVFNSNNIRPSNIIRYTDTSLVNPVFAKVISVGTTSIEIASVGTVPGITSSILPTTSLDVTDLRLLTTKLETSTDDTLYTRLPKANISNVDLTNSVLGIRTVFSVNISDNRVTVALSSGSNQIFLPFSPERYSLITSNGRTEVLTSDRIQIDPSGTQLEILNLLTATDTNSTLVATLRKQKVKEKIKRKNRVNSIIIDKSKYRSSGNSATTLNDGLTFGNYPFGTRVQDEIISLNTSDIIEIHGIFESIDDSNPTAPTVVLSSISGTTATISDLIIGEKIIGESTGAIAIVAEKITGDEQKISFIYKNQKTFREGESIRFEESKIQATVQTLDFPSFDISSHFIFTSGQESTFYDYGTIKRKSTFQEPTKKLKIYFSNGYYESNDDGDITTVNSYGTFDYSSEIQTVNGIRNSDIIDIRPRTSTYVGVESSRSPLEFYGRTFNQLGNSAKNILASDEIISSTFSFYLGRIDRIYLSKDGKVQVKYGVPSEKPEKPVSVDDSLEIGTINLPPYLYNVSQASIQFLEHKRYRDVDIKQLENRIKNLEYYTSLSLLETNTANLFIADNNGLNRFKSGFFVDNFTSLLAQEDSIFYKNSIDIVNKQLRPRHYTNSVNLIFGPVTGINPSIDAAFTPIEGINIKKSKDIITLDYAELEWLKQPFATRSETITPFLVSFWQGTLDLTPSSDTWIDTVRLKAKSLQLEGNYAETLESATRTLNIDPQTGFAPVIWNSWETNWIGKDIIDSNRTKSEFIKSNIRESIQTQTTSVIQDNLKEIRNTGVKTKSGLRTLISEQFNDTSIGDRIVSRSIVPHMRSRNIQFVSKNVKPSTQMYAFFDGVNVTKYCTPKLLEISMISGTFQIGEMVIGKIQNIGLNPSLGQDVPKISFRVAQPNHKEGPYNDATGIFQNNPYTNQILQATYSSTSNILNIDTLSLSNQSQEKYNGWVETGMILIGQSSGAQASITNVRLISDSSSTLIGSFYIPNPNTNIHPKFESGNKTFILLDNNLNDQNAANTLAKEKFVSSGILETVQENIISVRDAKVQNKQEFSERTSFKTTETQVTSSDSISQKKKQDSIIAWYEPLAQSFLVKDETGIFVTKCDIFFRSKDDTDIPVIFQLRSMENGFPSQKILPFSEIVLSPDDVTTSSNGSSSTTFEFDAPVYLEGGKEYCICITSKSSKYSVYISRIGESDISTQSFISNQPSLGFLFKSQNSSNWENSQWEDLKFTLYRADFLDSGSVEFYNPELTENNKQIPTLMPNSLSLASKKIRVGLGTSLQDSGLVLGNTVIQQGTNASGNYVGSAGSAVGTLNIINSGIGYTPATGSLTINNVNLVTVTGNGKNASANVTISNGVAIAATISNGGNGYQVGDIVGISTFGSVSVGRDSRFSIVSVANTNQLILDNVQGEFVVGSAKTVQYISGTGVVTLNSAVGGGVTISSIETITDGLHIKVNHQNHGMYSNENFVSISNVETDIKPTKLNSVYSSTSTGSISVINSGQFSTFENVGISTTNPGYLLIGDEIIKYTSVSGNLISDVTRGSNAKDYPVGTPVYKYELGGVSLRRINKTHNLKNVTISNSISFDSYHIKLDMSSDGVDRSSDSPFPKLHINQTKSTGGYNIKATQNIPYEIITPIVHNLTINGTTINASLRTVTGSSISGNEVSFADNGFEPISIGKPNYLDSTRIICSKINENNKLTNLPGNKSLNLRLQLDTVNSKLSPVIDAQRVSTILTSNRVNSVITDYALDFRVNTIDQDPSSFQYISKEINLETNASSIRILLNAHINQYCDIRALYSISDKSNFNPIFVPFPGYLNLNTRNEIINSANSDGRSDTFVTPSQLLNFETSEIEFKEYVFTANNLPAFKAFRIKLIITSTNQVYVPRLRDLRVIALA